MTVDFVLYFLFSFLKVRIVKETFFRKRKCVYLYLRSSYCSYADNIIEEDLSNSVAFRPCARMKIIPCHYSLLLFH